MKEFFTQTWPWYVSGPMIALVMFLLLFLGKSFGVSSTLRTACAISGAGKKHSFFNFDWKSEIWNIMFAVGTAIGSYIAFEYMLPAEQVAVHPDTKNWLTQIGISDTTNYLPKDIFTWESLLTLKGLTILGLGGFMIGFGARYAGGCTSGHAISGLSNLQLPSLIAVVGFFAGGLAMTYWLLPLIMKF